MPPDQKSKGVTINIYSIQRIRA